MSVRNENAVIGLLVCTVRGPGGGVLKGPELLDTLEVEQSVSAYISRPHWKASLIDLVDAKGYKCESVSLLKETKYGCNIIVSISPKMDKKPFGRNKPVTRGGRPIEQVRGLKTMASLRRGS